MQDKFSPLGSQIQDINNPNYKVDPNAKFHLICTEIANGEVPGVTLNPQIEPLGYIALGLASDVPLRNYTRGQIVLGGVGGTPNPDFTHGGGSDGVCDLSTQQGGVGTHYSLFPNYEGASPLQHLNVAHADFPWLFGVPASTSDTSDPDMANYVAQILKTPDGDKHYEFGPFILPKLMTLKDQADIDSVTPQLIVLGEISSLVNPPPALRKAIVLPATATTYSYALTPDASEPLQGTVTWYAEVYGSGGVTSNGVTVTVGAIDSTQVSLAVDGSVIGDVVLKASYTSTKGDLVFPTPITVVSIPSGATQTGIALSPSDAEVIAGESSALDIEKVYNDNSTQPVFLTTTAPAQFTSSNTSVLTVDSYGTMKGVTPGQVTVTASYGGYTAQDTVNVMAPGLGPQITSALTATATYGVPFSYQITALQNPTSFNAADLPSWLSINPASGTLFGTPTAVGSFPITIAAFNPSNQDDEPLVITVQPSAQTITFPVIPPQTDGEGTLDLGATSSSGLPLIYTVVSGPATVSGNVLTFTGTSSVVIQASQAGNGNYNAATSVKQTIKVSAASSKTTQTITFGTIGNQVATATVPLTVSASSGLPVTLKATGLAKLTGTTLTFTGKGAVSVTATQAGNTMFQEAPTFTQVFEVTGASQTITFSQLPDEPFGAPAITLSATTTSGLPITYKLISGPAALSTNKLTLTAGGTVVLQANQAGNALYSAAPSVTQSFTVTPVAQIITFPAITTKTYGVAPFTVLATAASKLPVTLSVVSGPATVAGSVCTITGAGTVELAADQEGNASYIAAPEVTTSFTVNKEAQTIAALAKVAAKTYTTVPFTIVSPKASSALAVTLTVLSGPATLTGNSITLNGVGTVVLAANQSGDANHLGAAQVTTNFVVSKATQTITAFTTLPAQTYGETPFTITPPTASSSLPVTVTVKSGPATISGNMVTLTGAGTVELAADQGGDANHSAAKEVVAKIVVKKAAQTISAFNSITTQTYPEAPFSITAPTASSGLLVTVKVKSGPAKITSGVVTLTGTGTVVLSASQSGNTNYNAATAVTTSFLVN